MAIRWVEILLAALVSVLLLLVEHWGPWQRLLRKRLHMLANYVLGILALYVPLTFLLIRWQAWAALAAIWVITLLGGGCVVVAYIVDGWAGGRERADLAESEAMLLRPKHDTGQAE